jgi:G3E family GTPase
VSEISAEERQHICAIIRAIQPKAKIIDCDYCDVPFGEILDTELFDFEEVATSASWIQKVEADVEEDHHHHHDHHDDHHHHHDHSHHGHGECEDPHCHCHHHHECDDPHCHCHNHGDEYGITTFVYYRRRPFDLARFDEFVARYWDKNIIRCKGICYFDEEYDMCYLFEQAGKQFDLKQAGTFYATMPQEELMQLMASDPMLQRDWDDHYGDRMQKLVFIGQHLDKETICQALDNCLV